jgi:hypothetical protein
MKILYPKFGCPFGKEFMSGWEASDRDRKYIKVYCSRVNVKGKRVILSKGKMKEQRSEEAAALRKNFVYGSGVGVQPVLKASAGSESVNTLLTFPALQNHKKYCSTCGGHDHQRTTNKRCPYYKREPAYYADPVLLSLSMKQSDQIEDQSQNKY